MRRRSSSQSWRAPCASWRCRWHANRRDEVVAGGTFSEHLGEVPVFNVSVPVMGRDFAVFELAGASDAAVH
ncbi:MAG TPA: hypothetical protein VNB64_05995 [Solirubrobacteraceae bacterium]|nr:hypothetical protein [Solirubrobacteraceae bacterium]